MIDFLRAGDSNGDAIVVKYGDTKDGNFYLQVIDGGFTDTGDQIISHIKQHFASKAKIADVVLSHADNDHATGLIKVLECEDFTITNLWMNRPWDYVDEVIDNFHGAYPTCWVIGACVFRHERALAQRAGLQPHEIPTW
jgi:glyoxylase-like metal-dependent hydrolase (beta-lactamase superfamily II)